MSPFDSFKWLLNVSFHGSDLIGLKNGSLSIASLVFVRLALASIPEFLSPLCHFAIITINIDGYNLAKFIMVDGRLSSI